MSFQFFNPSLKVTITRGDLPHWDQEGATYFITWRTADSIPREVWQNWCAERDAWLRQHGIHPQSSDWRASLEALPDEERQDFRRFSRTLETALDACHGACLLREPEMAEIVAGSLKHFDGERYTLGDFVIMPNHVHLLVGGMARQAMLRQVASWKKWTALKINESRARRGRLWQDESFDHLVRDERSFRRLRQYIADNPSKAGLEPGEYLHSRNEGEAL